MINDVVKKVLAGVDTGKAIESSTAPGYSGGAPAPSAAGGVRPGGGGVASYNRPGTMIGQGNRPNMGNSGVAGGNPPLNHYAGPGQSRPGSVPTGVKGGYQGQTSSSGPTGTVKGGYQGQTSSSGPTGTVKGGYQGQTSSSGPSGPKGQHKTSAEKALFIATLHAAIDRAAKSGTFVLANAVADATAKLNALGRDQQSLDKLLHVIDNDQKAQADLKRMLETMKRSADAMANAI